MYGDKYGVPKEMTEQDMEQVIQHIADADKAGIEVLEIRSAHGFLLHRFLSGNSNKCTDIFGSS